MNNTPQINQLAKLFSFVRIALVLMLVALVLTKPILAFAFESSIDKMELSSADSDQEEDSDQEQDSDEEEDSEEDSEEDNLEESEILSCSYASLGFALLNNDVDHHQKHTSDFRLGIIPPPPETV